MDAMKYAISLYKSSFRYLVLVGLTIVLPILFIYTLLVNYITLPFQLFNIPLWSTFFKIYFSAIAFALIQIPYISIFVQDLRHGEIKIRSIYGDSLRYMFSVYIVSIVCGFFVSIGMFLLIIPGLILTIFLLAIPYSAVFEELEWWKGIKQAVKFGRKYFFRLLGLFVVFGVLELIISMVAVLGLFFVTNLIFVLNLVLMGISIILIPLFIFIVSNFYTEWIEEEEGFSNESNIW